MPTVAPLNRDDTTTCLDLHAAAQHATRCHLHDLAARLYLDAAGCAMTESGAWVLLEKAALSAALAGLPVCVEH